MNQWPHWLTAAALAVSLLAQSAALPARAGGQAASLAARYGVEFGILASAGARVAAAAAEPAPAQPTPAGRPAAGAGPQATAASPAGPPAPSATPPAPTATPSPTEAAPPATPTPPPHRGRLIMVDAGHGGWDPGAVHMGAGGPDLLEAEVNLSIALRLAEMLRQDGYDVQMTRTGDQDLGPDELTDVQGRVDATNQAEADLLVSVHHNGQEKREARGTEVYYCSDRPYGAENRRLALVTQEALVRNLRQAGYDTVDRGAKDDAFLGHLALLAPGNLARPSHVPAIIGEALFITNDEDAAALRRPEIREAIARGYLEGIKAYFGDTPSQ